MKILTYSFPGAKITTRPVRFEISSSRNTAEGPRNRADIRHQCSQPIPNPCWCHHQRGVTIASPSLLPRDGTSRLSNSDRSKGDGTDWTERERKKEREREGGRIGRRDTNLYSCKIKSHRRSARLGETDQPGRPMQLICIKNRLFRPISCSATLAGTGQSGWLSFN